MPGRGGGRRSRRRPAEDAPTTGLPIVAIVGRPNVGKSTLFNRIVGQRRAIVEDRARTTRDRLYAVAEWNGRRFLVVDTGGLETNPGDAIEEKVQEQARIAIGEADVIVFMVDAAAGETPADQEAADILRTAGAPIILTVNKADNERRELEGAEFHRLGWSETYAVSALHGRGTGDLMDAIVAALPAESEVERLRREQEDAAVEQAEAAIGALAAEDTGVEPGEPGEPAVAAEAGTGDVPTDEAFEPRIAIVGRPNVGKSSLLNALLGEERTIVSHIPGTTRDAIDTTLTWQGRALRLVDTAGLRRRGKVAAGPAEERYSALRALRAIGRADVCVLVLDARDGLAAQDAHVAGYVVEEGVGLVLALNKWDLVEKDDKTFERYVVRIRAEAPFLDFAPVVAVSALTGQRVVRVLESALAVASGRRRRIPTAALNRVLSDAVARHPAPAVKGRRPRFLYATQATVEPPTFVVFAAEATAVHFSYKRFLENRLRDAFGFEGAPLRLVFRERSRIELEPRRRRSTSGRSRTAGAAARGGRPRRTTKPSPRRPG